MPFNAYLTIGARQTLGLVLGVLVFIAVLCGFVVLSKRLSKGSVFSGKGKQVKVIDRLMLSRDSAVMVVQIGSRLLAVGVGKGAPSFLCELSPEDFPEPIGNEPRARNPSGFWGRFAHNMKANMTGGKTIRPGDDLSTNGDSSFADVLRQISEKDPVSGAEDAGDAGYPHLREEKPQRFRRGNYHTSIENMTRLSEPDTLDRRSRYYGDTTSVRPPQPPAAVPPPEPPQPMPPAPAATETERKEQVDQLLDMIAQRQARMEPRKNTGDKG